MGSKRPVVWVAEGIGRERSLNMRSSNNREAKALEGPPT